MMTEKWMEWITRPHDDMSSHAVLEEAGDTRFNAWNSDDLNAMSDADLGAAIERAQVAGRSLRVRYVEAAQALVLARAALDECSVSVALMEQQLVRRKRVAS